MYKQAVVNASPLIFLSKAGVIHFLQQAAPDIVVPQVVALDRGAYPKKIGRWKGFLDQFANGSFGVLG